MGEGRCRFGDGFLSRGLGSGMVAGFLILMLVMTVLTSRVLSCLLLIEGVRNVGPEGRLVVLMTLLFA